MQKTCTQCGEIKDLEHFTRAKPSVNFKSTKSLHHTYCKSCNAQRAREWRKQRPAYTGSGRINSISKEDRLLMSAIRQRLADARGRCKKLKRVEPVLTDSYLYELFKQQNRSCALTGAPLSLITGDPLCLSLDQIEPVKGYIKGNVQWLAWCVNRAKGDLSMLDFYDMCETVLECRKAQRLSP